MHVACRLNKIMNIIWYDNKFLFYTFTKFPVNSIETTLACGNYLIFFNVEVTLKFNYFLQKVCKVYIWRAFGDIDRFTQQMSIYKNDGSAHITML